MANDYAFFDPHRVEHPDQVGDDLALGVSLGRLRTAGLAVAALVGRDRTQSGARERVHLMTPRVPQFRKSVAHHDRIAFTAFSDMHPDPIGIDEAMLELAHSGNPSTVFKGST
jgi:hypothetical protein